MLVRWEELKTGMQIRLPCGCAGKIELLLPDRMILRKWQLHGMPKEEMEWLGQSGLPLDETFTRAICEKVLFPAQEVTGSVPEWFSSPDAAKWETGS